MLTGHLFLIRVLIIILSLALVIVAFIHHHQKGQSAIFLISEIGIALLLALTSLTLGFWL